MSQHLPVHRAVERNDLKELLNLLREKGNVNERDLTLKTPLHVACTQNSIPIVTELIANGADVNAMDSNNWTPLHCAATEGRFEILELLLAQQDINVHILSQDGTSMFHYLVRFKPEPSRQELYLKMLQRCLDVGIDVNLPGKHQETPLHQASMKKNILAVQFLLEHNANVNSKNKFGETALYYAIQLDFMPLISLLLSYNADVNIVTKQGMLIDIAQPAVKPLLQEQLAKLNAAHDDNNNSNSNNNNNNNNNNISMWQEPTKRVSAMLNESRGNSPNPYNQLQSSVSNNLLNSSMNNSNNNNNGSNNNNNNGIHNNSNIAINTIASSNPLMNSNQQQLQLQLQQHMLVVQLNAGRQNYSGILMAPCNQCNEPFCYSLSTLIRCPHCGAIFSDPSELKPVRGVDE